MQYGAVISGRFLSRPNRFIAQVETGEGIQTVHVKNTGRCRELLVPGATVYLERSTSPGRKTAYDLIAVEKGNVLINMDAQGAQQGVWRVGGKWWFFAEGDSAPRGVSLRGIKIGFLPGDTGRPASGGGEGRHAGGTGGSQISGCANRAWVKHIQELQGAVKRGLTPRCFLWYNYKMSARLHQ